MIGAFNYIRKKHLLIFGGLARNRTWIWSFGNSYTIHCTTRPRWAGKVIISYSFMMIDGKLNLAAYFWQKALLMKRYAGLLVFIFSLSLAAGYFLSKIPLVGRLAMHFEEYAMYRPLKVWWKGALFVFVVLLVLLLVQHIMDKWLKHAKLAHLLCLALAVGGLIYTYNDFRDDYSHRWMRERFHIGGYLLWIGWVAICLFFLFTSKPEPKKPQVLD